MMLLGDELPHYGIEDYLMRRQPLVNGEIDGLLREVLMDKVWGLGVERENRTLDVHIRTLRQKLGSVGSRIQTVRGVGYRLEDREG